MRTIDCDSCDERFYSAATPGVGRCPSCSGRLVEAWSSAELVAGDVPPALAHVPEAAAGSYPTDRQTYPSLHAFLIAEPRRIPSAERDIGLRWRGADERVFRAAWVAATGELYIVQGGQAEYGGGHVELLGSAPSEPALRSALDGWEEICGTECSLDWLRARAARELQPGGGVEGQPALR